MQQWVSDELLVVVDQLKTEVVESAILVVVEDA